METKRLQIYIPIEDIMDEQTAYLLSEEHLDLKEIRRKFDIVQLENALDLRYDDFFATIFLILKQPGKTISEVADMDDAYDAFRKERLKTKYLKTILNMPKKVDEVDGKENFVYLKVENRLAQMATYIYMPDDEESKGIKEKDKLKLPEKYIPIQELEINKNRYVLTIEKKFVDITIKNFSNQLTHDPEENKKRILEGREVEVYKYLRALENAESIKVKQ